MGVDIQTYRARIGTYRHSHGVNVVTQDVVINFNHGLKTVGSVMFIGILLIMAGVEQNPGPREFGSLKMFQPQLKLLLVICLLFVEMPSAAISHNMTQQNASQDQIFTCNYLCGNSNTTETIAPPKFEHPCIPNDVQPVYFTKQGSVHATITWAEPFAIDRNGKTSRVEQVKGGINGGDFYGTVAGEVHTIVYLASDIDRLTDNCIFSFSVFVPSCPKLGVVQDGRHTCTNGTSPGSSCFFSCEEGFSLSGSGNSTCEYSSKSSHFPVWNNRVPQCEKTKCGKPILPDNADLICTDNDYSYQTVCRVKCKQGYIPAGPLYSLCQVNGTWSKTAQCIRQQSDYKLCSLFLCNGHTCIRHHNNTFACKCSYGWSGTNCEILPDLCGNSMCMNGATCNIQSDSYKCSCLRGYSGSLCQIKPVDGGWSDWSFWSKCSVTCGSGVRTRQRSCNNPPPDTYGQMCEGSNTEITSCNSDKCEARTLSDPGWGGQEEHAIDCPQLYQVNESMAALECETDNKGLKTCVLNCKNGTIQTPWFKEFETLRCGWATNYTWVPGKVLAPCVVPAVPNELRLQSIITYQTYIPSDEYLSVKKRVMQNIKETLRMQSTCCNVTLNISSNETEGTSNLELVFRFIPGIVTMDAFNTIDKEAIIQKVRSAILILESTAEFLKNFTNDALEVNTDEATFSPQKSSLQWQGYVNCPKKQVSVNGICVRCPAGTFIREKTCSFCPKGTYQGLPGQTSCIMCPQGYTTYTIGSVYLAQCYDMVKMQRRRRQVTPEQNPVDEVKIKYDLSTPTVKRAFSFASVPTQTNEDKVSTEHTTSGRSSTSKHEGGLEDWKIVCISLGGIAALVTIVGGIYGFVTWCLEKINAVSEEEQELLDYTKKKKDFQDRLVGLYKQTVVRVPVLPLRPSEETDDIGTLYCEPMLEEKYCEISINEIFTSNNDKRVSLIYVLGEAGTGKSVFCIYLVSQWCKAHAPTAEDESDEVVKTLKTFEYLFYIKLRHNIGCDSIKSMLDKQHDEKDKCIINSILENESSNCLILLDGLDEWTQVKEVSQYHCEGLPARDLDKQYTVLTTSRPWKFKTLDIRETEVDKNVTLKGLTEQSRQKMETKLIDILNSKSPKGKTHEEFKEKLAENPLSEISNTPIILQQLIYLWFNDKLHGTSVCFTYSGMLELFFDWLKTVKKDKELAKLKDSQDNDFELPDYLSSSDSCNDFKNIISFLSQLAYERLFNGNKEQSLSFTRSTFRYIPKKVQNCILKTGILIEDRFVTLETSMRQESSFSFIHKTMQEFLASVYIANHFKPSAANTFRENRNKCVEQYFKDCRTVNDILEHSNVLIMLSGLKPQLITNISNYINEIVKLDATPKEFSDPSGNSLLTVYPTNYSTYVNVTGVQKCINRCVEEVAATGNQLQQGIHLANIFVKNGYSMSNLCEQAIILESVLTLHSDSAKYIKRLPKMTSLTSLNISKAHLSGEDCSTLCTFLTQSTQIENIAIFIYCNEHKEHWLDLSKHDKIECIDFSICDFCFFIVFENERDERFENERDVTPTISRSPEEIVIQGREYQVKCIHLSKHSFECQYRREDENKTYSLHILLPSVISLSTLKLARLTLNDPMFAHPSDMKSLRKIKLEDTFMSMATWCSFIDSLPALPNAVEVETSELKIKKDGEVGMSSNDYSYYDAHWNTNGEFTSFHMGLTPWIFSKARTNYEKAIQYVSEKPELFTMRESYLHGKDGFISKGTSNCKSVGS